MSRKKEEMKAITVKIPISLMEEIDQICSTNYVSRSSWLIKAAKAQLDHERLTSTEEILARIASKEEK